MEIKTIGKQERKLENYSQKIYTVYTMKQMVLILFILNKLLLNSKSLAI